MQQATTFGRHPSLPRARRLDGPARSVRALAVICGAFFVAVNWGAWRADAGEARPGLGVYLTHGEEEQIEAYEKWLGRKLDVIMEFTPGNNWDELVGTRPGLGLEWWLGIWERPYRRRVVISLPMLPGDGSASIEKGAAGEYDERFRAIAAKLVAAGYGRNTIRLGWEFNGGWFKWSAQKNPKGWAEYWRRIVAAMRSVEGAQFQFNWCGTVGDCGMNPADAYPGNEWVDQIGCDIYDQSWHPNAYPHKDGEEAWRRRWRQDNAWRSMVEWGNYNLNWWAEFARKKGKPMTVPEWGLAGRKDGHGGEDNPLFVERMHRWLHDPANNAAWHAYFEEDNAEIRSRLYDSPQYPQARERYVELFGAPKR